MNFKLLKKINYYICGILSIFVMFCVSYCVHSIIRNYIISYLIDIFILGEFIWVISESVKDNKKEK